MRALVFSIDDAYVMPFKVLWHSLMKTESVPERTPIFILHTETLTATSISDLQSFFSSYERTASFMDARQHVPDDLPISHHVSKATYYRLYLASILPPDIDSAVYLDSDAVVIRSIRELFELRLTHPIAAADHMSPRDAYRLWGPRLGTYFQAGVLVVDLENWRQSSIEKEFARILLEERPRILWWDQDVLNIFFRNNWQRISILYNLCGLARSNIDPAALFDHGCYLHFDGRDKPWLVKSRDWGSNYWRKIHRELNNERGGCRLLSFKKLLGSE